MNQQLALAPFRSTASQSTASRWFLAGLVLFFAILAGVYFAKINGNMKRSAFLRWQNQVADLWQGVDIWDQHNYPNPPIMAVILTPFMELPGIAAPFAWFAFKAGLTVWACVGLFRWLDRSGRPFPFWGQCVGIVLLLRPIEGDLIHGNVNLFILFLIAAMTLAYLQGKDILAGLVLGLAIACKVTPALFLPYLLWKRAWRTLGATAVGLTLFLVLIPGGLFGFQNNFRYLDSWLHQMVYPFVFEGEVTSEHSNQSLPGLAYRMLCEEPSFSRREGTEFIPLEYHNFANLSHGQAQVLLKLIMVAFIGVVAWSCRTPSADRGNWRLLAEFGVVVLGMLIFSERTWKHHCVTLLIPFAGLAYALSALELKPWLRWSVGGSLLATGFLMVLTSTGAVPGYDRLGEMAQVYGAYTLSFFIMLAALTMLLRYGPVEAKPHYSIVQARISLTTDPFAARCNGLPERSVSMVSGSMPNK